MIDERVLDRIPSKYRPFIEIASPPEDVLSWRGEPWCLIFIGDYGVGKSSMAARMVCEFGSDRPPFNLGWVNCATLNDDLRREISHPPDHGPRIVERISTATLLVLDDLAASRKTEYAMETIRHILCHRYEHLLPTIITADDRMRGFEGRLLSRMAEGIWVNVEGEDKRRTKHAGRVIHARA